MSKIDSAKKTWTRPIGDPKSYRGYQASNNGAEVLVLPKGGSVVVRKSNSDKDASK